MSRKKYLWYIKKIMKKNIKNEFGKRLTAFRKAMGLTQRELGESVGVSYRVIAYYEKETKHPPARLIVPLAETLGITADELLGKTEIKKNLNTRNTALFKKLKIVEKLPAVDQKAVLHYIKMIAKNRGIDQKSPASFSN